MAFNSTSPEQSRRLFGSCHAPMWILRNLMLALMLSAASASLACDMCGCGVGGYFQGILPQFNSTIGGLRLHGRSFVHPSTSLNFNGSSQVLSDDMYAMDAWFRWFPARRWMAIAAVPYVINRRTETEHTDVLTGLGDATMLAQYILINTADSLGAKLKNMLMAGGGLRVPTGKYQQRSTAGTMFPMAFQAGSGAYAFMAAANHTLRFKSWGLQTQYFFTHFMENELAYAFGQRHQWQWHFFKWVKMKSSALLPSVGWMIERATPDKEFGIARSNTGFFSASANFGLDYYKGRWMLQAFVQYPLIQNVGMAQPTGNQRLGLSVFYVIKEAR